MMITTMLLLLAATALSAQQRGQRGPEKAPFAELELSAGQQQQIKAIHKESRKKMEALRKANPEQRPNRKAMKKIRAESRAEMESILTPEQRTKLTELQAARKEARANVDKKALKADLKDVRKEAMKTVSAARGQLDQFISEEDKVAIDRLRGVYTTNPMAAKRGKGKRGERPDEAAREAQKAAVQKWKETRKDEIAEAKALAAKYAEDMARIQVKLAPQMEKWEEKKREIVTAHFPESMAPKREGKKGRAKRADASEGKKGKRAVAFLLMKG